MSGRSPEEPPKAFSLVELLISLAILSALLGLLLPSLAGARDAARSAACASNIRQLQLANDLYASDHAGRYVAGAADILANRHRWHGARAGASGPFEPAAAPLAAYLAGAETSAAVRACPAFVETLDSLRARSAGFEASCGGYGYNNAFVGVERVQTTPGAWTIGRDDVGARRERFVAPARTIAFADAALAFDRAAEGVIEYSFVEPRFWPEWPGVRPDPSIHFRHGARAPAKTGGPPGAASVAWLDGHVSTERLSTTWTSGYYAADALRAGVGWLGDADDNSLFDHD